MKNLSKLILMGLFVLLVCNSCETEYLGPYDSAIIESTTNPVKFSQLTFILNLHHPDFGYLCLDRIDSLKIKANAEKWGTFTSEWVDTTGRMDIEAGSLGYSQKAVNYLFVAPYRVNTDNLNTAGDVVRYMQDKIALVPGDYVCEITEVKFRDLEDNIITLKTQLFADFRVIENTSSSYIGKLTIELEN